MKALLGTLAMTLSFSFSEASLPPTKLKSNAKSGTGETTYTFVAPNLQATKIGATSGLIETGNENLFENGSFEGQDMLPNVVSCGSHLNTAGFSSDGSKWVSCASMVTVGSVVHQDVTPVISIVNRDLRCEIDVSTSYAGFSLCSRVGGVEGTCTPIAVTTGYKRITHDFTAPQGSVGCMLKSTNTSNKFVDYDRMKLAVLAKKDPVREPRPQVLVFQLNPNGTIAWQFYDSPNPISAAYLSKGVGFYAISTTGFVGNYICICNPDSDPTSMAAASTCVANRATAPNWQFRTGHIASVNATTDKWDPRDVTTALHVQCTGAPL